MSFAFDGPVVLAGAGKMGGALLSGWLAGGLKPSDILIQEPNISGEAAALAAAHGLTVVSELPSLDRVPAAIVVAVKPQVLDAVFPPLARLAGVDTVIMSIAAGKSIASFERHLPSGAAVVRAMPNTPAAIGRGISGAVANANTSASQRAVCQSLLAAVGDVVWLDQEALIDAVTAVSGSGPAYVFALVEAMTSAGVDAGLDQETAQRLARATVSGAGELLARSKDDAATLRQNVTSPGGTTAAGLAVLMREGSGLKELVSETVLAAQKRGRELGS
ncbi:pyrroline-5-carboxylate reductase [Hyphomicrobium methylovorum]|uniref:pyrroline-5-carboxylate reductase n=1 Tax=Hyphomicrobium methylovorum TaxID=84 RepID=UPI0015E64BA0|nr:pyrroline-5-carboxylate reductase [Hyphomicrobium methylovorum]MBA2126941.1 pyrroline-5-carboxylate reductase [Hyphomicrobium methylovorum]